MSDSTVQVLTCIAIALVSLMAALWILQVILIFTDSDDKE